MRASFAAIVVLAGSTFLLVGCGHTASPTSPTSVPSSIGASSTPSPLGVSPAATHQVPFKGSFEGSDTVMPPTIVTRAAGTGAHLGRFSFSHTLTFPALTGSSQWVAANGDTIETTSVVVSSVLGPAVRTNTENHTITGGTGRFSGAQGSFTVVRKHVLAPSDDGTHATSGSFEGTITSPGASD
jgi:hypothetical protein